MGNLCRPWNPPTDLRETSGVWFRVAEVVARFQMDCVGKGGPAGVCEWWGVLCNRCLLCIMHSPIGAPALGHATDFADFAILAHLLYDDGNV